MAVNVFLIFSAVILWRFILGVNKGFSGKAGSMVDIVTEGYSATVYERAVNQFIRTKC